MDFNNSDFVKAARDAMAKAFGIKTEVDMETKIANAEEKTEEPKSETIDVKNTWDGKEHRKKYRGAKSIDKHCRNHNFCPYCRNNRLYSSKKALEAAKEKIKDENHSDCSI